MLKPFIKKVVEGQDLTLAEAEAAMNIIMHGEATPAQVGGYLVALRMKGECVAEIAGSARAMRANASPIVLPMLPTDLPLIDTAGTGGDGAQTFNISTTAAFIIAGAGYPVAKHGNRAASSRSGSADVLEALGVNLNLTPAQVGACIAEVGIGFLFAPTFHPAMRHAIGPRRELGTRTIFNVLGPLTNPAGASHQLIGVFAPHLTTVLANVLGELGSTAAFVVHGHDGLDELTTGGPNQVSELRNGRVTSYTLDPRNYGFAPAPTAVLRGGDPAENAAITLAILRGTEQGARRDVALLNAAAGLATHTGDFGAGVALARQSLQSGAALAKLEALVAYSVQFMDQG